MRSFDLLQGILGYGFMQINTPTLAGWRWIYIVEGAMTVTAGIVAWFFIVDFPQKAKFLHDYERERIIDRLNKDRGDGEHDQITPAKVVTHLSDWKLWVFGLAVSHPTATANFSSSVSLQLLMASHFLFRIKIYWEELAHWQGHTHGCRFLRFHDVSSHHSSLYFGCYCFLGNFILGRSDSPSNTFHLFQLCSGNRWFRSNGRKRAASGQTLRRILGSFRSRYKCSCCSGVCTE
jgi:hypothetical protein